ncbi:MAG: CBS domain-containing protein [Deltaproteobacteria bacterium]|nr:CBS domain-containing protein [Deltaproteobacteria bacterium]
MKVRERMSPNPVIIGPEATVDEALKVMKEHGVRHLPVMEENRLVGLVTDVELRTAWFPSLLEQLVVRDVMLADPPTIEAEDTVYQAARLLHRHKLTGLLVLDEGRLAGIITLADILKVFVEILGLLEETSRLDVTLPPGEGKLQEVHTLLRQHGLEVISLAHISTGPEGRVYSFRLPRADLGPVKDSLVKAGLKVVM